MDKTAYLERNISQQPAIDLLRSMGYTYISQEDCSLQRGSDYHVLLKDILRGQLTESFSNWRKSGATLWQAFLMHTLCFNFLTRPQFIAFGRGHRPLCWFLGRAFGAMTVYWTERPDSDHAWLEKRYDCRIFEHYRPETRY